MNQIFVRIESIYNIALGKILLDGREIVFVSSNSEMQEFLSIDSVTHPHDVHIGDLDKREGIIIKGVAQAVRKIENLLREILPDCIVFSHPIQQDAIYFSKIIRYIYRKNLAIVDLGGGTKGIIFNINANVGEKLLVQVKELTTEADKLPICSTVITLSGNFVILEEGTSFVRVSRKIRGNNRRRLHDFGKKILPKGFGIIIRTSAQYVKEEEISIEIDDLINLWERIDNEASTAVETVRLISGEMVTEIMFGNASKSYLDKVRAIIRPTIQDYHHFKSYSMASGFALDYIQNFIDLLPVEDLYKTLEKMVISRDYPINNHIKAQFSYLDGTQEEIILGDLIKNEGMMTTSKILDEMSIEEFPNFTIQTGDRMECIFSSGSWTVHYRYYSGETGELIGERLRIITPMDLVYRGRVRAFDMGMNLYKKAHGDTSVSIVDNSVTNMVERGMISKKLDEKLGEVLRIAMKSLDASDVEILIQID